MKKHILSFTVIAFMAGFVLTSCGNASKKDMKQAGENLEQAAINAQKEIKTEVTANWEKFKMESDSLIKKSDQEITALKANITKTNKKERDKLTETLDKLEHKNKDLKDKIAARNKEIKENLIEFNDKAKEKEQQFEQEFKRDMNALGTALKDFFKDNVK